MILLFFIFSILLSHESLVLERGTSDTANLTFLVVLHVHNNTAGKTVKPLTEEVLTELRQEAHQPGRGGSLCRQGVVLW